jgi:WD40 repeat protein
MSEIQQPEIIAKSEMVEGPKSMEVTEKYLRLTPEGRAKINYVDGLLNTLIDTPNIELKKDIIKHIEQIESPNYEEYGELGIFPELKGVGPFTKISIFTNGEIMITSKTDNKYIVDPDTKLVVRIMSSQQKDTLEGMKNRDTNIDSKNRILTVADKYSVLIQNFENGKEVGRLTGHNGCIRSLCDLSDGKIVSVSDDKTIRIWDPETCKEVKIIQTDTWVNTLNILPDDRIVTSNRDSINIWDPKSGDEIIKIPNKRNIDGTNEDIVNILPNGNIITNDDNRDVLRIIDSNTGEEIQKIVEPRIVSIHTPVIRGSMVLLGDYIITGSDSGLFRIRNSKTGEEIKNIKMPFGNSNNLDFSLLPDGRIIYIYSGHPPHIIGDPNIDYEKFSKLAYNK